MDEEEALFDRPVKVLTGRTLSATRQVKTAAQAATYLLNGWPASPGEKHLAARKACLAALMGVKKARAEHLARKARDKAAPDARASVRETVDRLLADAAKAGISADEMEEEDRSVFEMVFAALEHRRE